MLLRKNGVIEVYSFCSLPFTRIHIEKVLYRYSILIKKKLRMLKFCFLGMFVI